MAIIQKQDEPYAEWQQWIADGRPDGDARNRLIEPYLPQVMGIAHRVAESTGWIVRPDDLYGAMACGLIEAAHKYDPDHGAPFGSFAYTRVWGAMMDELRQSDPLKKTHRRTVDAMQAAEERLAAAGERVTLEALAAAVGMTEEQVQTFSRMRMHGSLDVDISPDGNRSAIMLRDNLSARCDPPTESQLAEELQRMAKDCTFRVQVILYLRYIAGAKQDEVADILNLSPTRISQLENRGKRKIKEQEGR